MMSRVYSGCNAQCSRSRFQVLLDTEPLRHRLEGSQTRYPSKGRFGALLQQKEAELFALIKSCHQTLPSQKQHTEYSRIQRYYLNTVML